MTSNEAELRLALENYEDIVMKNCKDTQNTVYVRFKFIKQEVSKAYAKKPVPSGLFLGKYRSFKCPNCMSLKIKSAGVKYNYCQECGQHIDWEGIE